MTRPCLRSGVLRGVLGGVALGLVLALVAGGGPAWWRAPVVGAAAGLLVVGLGRLRVLAGREWRREAPGPRAYVGAVWPLVAALVLAGVATA